MIISHLEVILVISRCKYILSSDIETLSNLFRTQVGHFQRSLPKCLLESWDNIELIIDTWSSDANHGKFLPWVQEAHSLLHSEPTASAHWSCFLDTSPQASWVSDWHVGGLIRDRSNNGAGHINWNLFKVDALCCTQVEALLKSQPRRSTIQKDLADDVPVGFSLTAASQLWTWPQAYTQIKPGNMMKRVPFFFSSSPPRF